MKTLAIKTEVERRVNERLIPALFEKAKLYHARHEYLNCYCDYCVLKRVVTIRIANIHRSYRNKAKIMIAKKLNNALESNYENR